MRRHLSEIVSGISSTEWKAVRAFADAVDVVTFEFENVPDATLAAISERMEVRPSIDALRISQDRAIEKTFLNDNGIGTAPWAPVKGPDDYACMLAVKGADDPACMLAWVPAF